MKSVAFDNGASNMGISIVSNDGPPMAPQSCGLFLDFPFVQGEKGALKKNKTPAGARGGQH